MAELEPSKIWAVTGALVATILAAAAFRVTTDNKRDPYASIAQQYLSRTVPQPGNAEAMSPLWDGSIPSPPPPYPAIPDMTTPHSGPPGVGSGSIAMGSSSVTGNVGNSATNLVMGSNSVAGEVVNSSTNTNDGNGSSALLDLYVNPNTLSAQYANNPPADEGTYGSPLTAQRVDRYSGAEGYVMLSAPDSTVTDLADRLSNLAIDSPANTALEGSFTIGSQPDAVNSADDYISVDGGVAPVPDSATETEGDTGMNSADSTSSLYSINGSSGDSLRINTNLVRMAGSDQAVMVYSVQGNNVLRVTGPANGANTQATWTVRPH